MDTSAAADASDTSLSARRLRSRWYRTPTLVTGAAILGVVIFLAVAAPLVTRYSPIEQDLSRMLEGPSADHWLGTDHLGRDLWSRLVYGARVDLKIGMLAVILPFIIGTILGSLSGYFGRWMDAGVMRLADVVVSFPFYVLIIAIVFVLGPGERNIYIAITLVGWVAYARILRGEILVAKRREYVLAAQAGGLGSPRIIVRHLLPNVLTQAIVFAMSDIVLCILAVVTLGYLGLGIQPPTPEWGNMIADGQAYILSDWRLSTLPGIFIVVTALGLSLIGDGLSDLLKPE